MVDVVFVVLLIAHIGSVVAWMGGAILFISVISPSLSNMSPSTRSDFMTATLPRYLRFVTGSSVAAIAAGLILYAYMTQVLGFSPNSPGLISIDIGAIIGFIGLIGLFAFTIPAGRKLISISSQMPNTPGDTMTGEMASVQRRLMIGGRSGVALLGLALVFMILGAQL